MAWPAAAGAAGKGGGTVVRNRLHLPALADATSTLRASPARLDLGGGRLSDAFVYNGVLTGPTFEVTRGTAIAATLQNHLADRR